MTPKKAIIIVLVLFLIMIMVFTFLYLKKQLAVSDNNNRINIPANSTDQQASSSVQQKIEAIETKTVEQIEEIAEQGKTATGGITQEAGDKIIEAETQELMEKLKLRTPEQLKADQQRKAELEKMRQQEILQVESQLQNK